MNRHSSLRLVAAAASALLVTACGGGSGEERPQFASPPPPPPPAPPPPPPPAGVSGPFGATSNMQFPTVGDDFEIRWDSESRAYELSAAGEAWERLTYIATPSVGGGAHYPEDGAYFLNLYPLGNQYTMRATVHENAWGFQIGQFAFGTPTAEGDVPATGTATFAAEVWGTGTNPGQSGGSFYDVTGNAHLAFDFGAGNLSGYMDTNLAGPTGSFTAPRYEFTQTVFAVGSTSFSGGFIVPGSTADSYFSGRFTGSQAAELMAQWQAPFVDQTSGQAIWGTMSGIWVGRRAP